MEKRDYIKSILKNWFETEKLVSLWNNYCSEHELEDAFRDYYQTQTIRVYEDSLDDYNLLDDDWDEIIKEIKEKS